jgi:hypothetical protein
MFGGVESLRPQSEVPVLIGTLTLNNMSPRVNDNIIATYNGGNGSGTETWVWLADNAVISGANSNTYTVATGDLGKQIKARVSFASQKGFVESAATAAVIPAVVIPDVLTGTVTINNNSPRVGDTLTAAYHPGNGTGTPTWEWLVDGNKIDGANSNTYTVVHANRGKQIKARVSYSDQSDFVESVPVQVHYIIPAVFTALAADGSMNATTTKLTLTFNIDISGLTAEDITLTPNLTKGLLNRISTGVYELTISGINAITEITAEVIKSGYEITPASRTTTVYPQPNAGIIIGNTTVRLFLNNSPTPLQENGSTSIEAGIGTYTVNIAPGNYSEINWFLNGALIPQWSNNTSLVLTRRIPGLYLVSVEATLAGERNTGRHFFVIEGGE